ncbi:MAG TPA: 50S ribosomal protein L18 [Chitinophagaceae bacterium]|nr:50S ribosomal protein L18 [Chitinophagaceae bacterium]
MDVKVVRRQKLKWRIRKKISGTASRPRLSVFRSNAAIYCQIIDDVSGKTLVSANSRTKGFDTSGTKVEVAQRVGKAIAAAALAKGISNCVFDRGGYLYHGRVKAVADGAREGGLQF